MRTANLPSFSRAIRCQDERALPCADQNSYVVHSFLLIARLKPISKTNRGDLAGCDQSCLACHAKALAKAERSRMGARARSTHDSGHHSYACFDGLMLFLLKPLF